MAAPIKKKPEFNRIIAIGASAGGIEAVQKLLKHLPKDLATPILIVIHLFPSSRWSWSAPCIPPRASSFFARVSYACNPPLPVP